MNAVSLDILCGRMAAVHVFHVAASLQGIVTIFPKLLVFMHCYAHARTCTMYLLYTCTMLYMYVSMHVSILPYTYAHVLYEW